jgi:hypothetical protein
MNCTEKQSCYLLITILILFCANTASALQPKNQTPVPVINNRVQLREIATLPKHIREASGLEFTTGKHLWTHNDGGVPILYCIDTTGAVIKTIQLNHPNAGWEDIALNSRGNMFVGAFGNNKNDKQTLKIYKIPNPDSVPEKVVNASIIRFHYADQHAFPPTPDRRNFDMDAFIAKGDSLFLFSKNRTSPFTGYTKIYGLSQEPGEQIAIPVDSIYLGAGPMLDHWVTGADISPDGKLIALLSHRHIWFISDFHGQKFSAGKIQRIDLNHFSHKAGICFKDNSHLYIVDELELEIIGGKLYTIDVSGLPTGR